VQFCSLETGVLGNQMIELQVEANIKQNMIDSLLYHDSGPRKGFIVPVTHKCLDNVVKGRKGSHHIAQDTRKGL
jgi:hypothetical protein